MAAALFGKKEPGNAESAETPSDNHPSELELLTGRLGQLGELLEKANEQVAAYLVRRESQAEGGAGENASGGLGRQIAALSERLDQVDAGVKTLCESSTGKDAASEGAGASILEAVQRLQGRLEGGLERIVDLLAPPEEPNARRGSPDPAETAWLGQETGHSAGSAHWEWAFLGPDLAQRPNLAFERGRLLSGVLEGDSGACALAGQLLVFQSAPAERLPQLLKDLGEAFYRWRPKTVDQPDHAPHGARSVPGTDPMEEALVEWLRRSCEAAGISNTIALVHPGERFDSTRHTAASRGVEITEVHGWIVLRDNGKVYTKAAVAVQ